MKRFLFFLVFIVPISTLPAQNTIGLPEITNYSNQGFHGGTQTWDIAQDKAGILYFANNDGLLTYDGNYWKLYPIPNRTNVRSVAVDAAGRIFIGAQDEIGYFFPDEHGELKYHSLKPLLPENARHFEDIWDLVIAGDAVLFRAKDMILQLKDNQVRVFPAPLEWRFLCKSGQLVLAQDKARGLMVLQNDHWETYCAAFTGENQLITSIMDFGKDSLLVATFKNGLYLLKGAVAQKMKTSLDPVFTKSQVFSGIRVNEHWYAIGTVTSGCFIIDHNGKVIQQFSRKEGMQNNNILSIFLDREHNLWSGLDNGIDFIAYGSPIKQVFTNLENQVSAYATKIFNNRLFIGTSSGLYQAPLNLQEKDLSFSKGSFSLVKNSQGQVWNLSIVHEQLLAGHHEGTFLIKDNTAIQLPADDGSGSWLFQSLFTHNAADNELVIMGTYAGLKLLDLKNGARSAPVTIKGLKESLRFVTLDDDSSVVWASHPYRGVYRLQLSADRKFIVQSALYTEKNGLPSSLGNYIFQVRHMTVVATTKGIYQFNRTTNRFERATFFADIFKNQELRYLKEDDDGNIWFVTDTGPGVVDFHKKNAHTPYTIVYFPELNGKILFGFENIYPYDAQNVFIGGKKGIYLLNYYQYLHNTPQLNVVLGQVKAIAKKDSLIFGGYFANEQKIIPVQPEGQNIALPNKWNSFHFEYTSTLYSQHTNTEFSYQLYPFDKGWSEWSPKTEKDYTNLPPGTYTFKVKARNNLGDESPATAYTFKVEPAWYQSSWAYALYLVLITGALFFIIKNQQQKFASQQLQYEEEQERLKYLHQLELDQNEKEIIALKNEKLESEVQFKNRELGTVTMHLVERGKLLSRIKEELKQVSGRSSFSNMSDELKNVIRLLNEAEKHADDWEHFSMHFDEVHNNFLSNIKKAYPSLSATDLKLCAYLKMNLSSKEIAQLMNISVKGVEISRYRLRKKLDIPTEVNLYDFLIKVSA